MNARAYRQPGRSGATFLCRYVQRTLGQLGDEALTLSLVSRHLADCPACRAHRRRVAMVDRALQRELLWETPPVFEGRWAEISTRLGIAAEPERPERNRTAPRTRLLTTALLAMALLVGTAWSVDHAPPDPVPAIAAVPGVTVTAASVEGEEVAVNVEQTDPVDGTVYLWLDSEEDDGAGSVPEQK
jgi:anti-sigma factor RsiW